MNKSIFNEAKKYIGFYENNRSDRKKLIKLFAKHKVHCDPATTSWCAAFVNSILGECGFEGSDKLTARSLLTVGKKVTKPKIGDVVVFWRVNPNSWQGHVGFYAGETAQYIKVLGGNQKNSVCYSNYGKSRLLGYRRFE